MRFPFFRRRGAPAGMADDQRRAASDGASEAARRIAEARAKRAVALDLSGLDLAALPEEIGQLSQLQELDLDRNQLTALPAAIGQLSQLQQLLLSGNRLTALPEAIGRLSQLRYLDLSGNPLTGLPEAIGQLSQLQRLDLSGNRLTALPEAISRLSDLRELCLHDNPGLGLPAELLGPTWVDVAFRNATPANPADILDFYRRSRGGARSLNEARLILVGFGDVGKISLVNQLVNDRFTPGEARTEGIAITQWPIRLNGEEDVRLHVWDFGGQEIMHATHRFFLSERGIYLLVLNGRGGRQQADAAYWLNLIASHAPDSPVIIVRNKIREDPCALDSTALRRDFPAIRDVIDTDCDDRPGEPIGISGLRAAIRRETDLLADLRSRFPTAWFAIKDRLSAMPENYVNFTEYRALCADHGETDPAGQESLAHALHCLGIALNFRDDPRLHDTNVLNPHWVTRGVYGILNDRSSMADPAELRVGDVRGMLDAAAFPPEQHGFLLRLMQRFELAVPFPEDDTRYLVPERLGVEQPPDVGEFAPETCLNFVYEYPTLLPEGLLPRLIVRTHILSTGLPRWRAGVVLRLEDNRALVLGDTVNRRVTIRIDGPPAGRRRLLAVIRYDLDHIHRNYKFAPRPIVPVPGHPDETVAYDDLLAFERDGIREFPKPVDGRTRMLNVRELLDGVDLAPPPAAGAAERGDTRRVTAFVSYAHKDEALREELDTVLKILGRGHDLDAWNDRRISPGEKWEGVIDENLRRVDVVLLLSRDFLASDYCRKEMEIALEREADGQARVIPIIARPCHWRDLRVQANQALPKDGKPIADAGTDQTHRDAAWTQVETGLRRVLQSLPRRPGR